MRGRPKHHQAPRWRRGPLLGGPWLPLGIALALSGPASVTAQATDLVSVGVQYAPPVDAPEAPPATAQVTSYDLQLNAPIPLGERSVLVAGLAYHVDSVTFDNEPEGFVDLRAFHAVSASAFYVRLLPKDWSLAMSAGLGLAGDFLAVDGGLVRVNAMVLAAKATSERLTVGFGAVFNYAFGVPLPLPALRLDWHPTPAFQLELLFPGFFRVGYSIGNRFEIGARLEISGNEYAIRDDRLRGGWPCQAEAADDPATVQDETVPERANCVDSVAYSFAAAGLTVGVRLFSSVWLSLYGGRTVFRRFAPRNADGGDVTDAGDDLPNQFFIRATLTFRAPGGSGEE